MYETVSGTRSLKYIVTPQGRAVKNGSAWVYEYNLTDHLGNVRVVIKKGATGLAEIVQQKGYYSFGMEISQFSAGTGTSKNWYNGKEIQDDFGLYWYDYGARFYDPMIGRWSVIDNKAEKYYGTSPYTYALNNPILFIDPDGQEVVDALGSTVVVEKDKSGKYTGNFSFAKGTTQKVIDQFMANGGTLLKEMMTIETGTKYVTAAVESDEKISYKISEKTTLSDTESGNRKLGGTIDVPNEIGGIEKTQITIYKGSIKGAMADGKLDSRLTLKQNMAARAVHETHHATNKDDIKVRREQGPGKLSKEQHQNAYNAGSNATFEFQLLKGIIK